MSAATARGTAYAVAVHLAAHRATGKTVRRWCDAHSGSLTAHGVAARTSDTALRRAVPGLEWRYDRGRRLLHDHLVPPDSGRTLFSSAAILGPAYRHTGGRLHADAPAGVAALSAALRGVPWRVHLSVGTHADTAVTAWVDAVRHGHLVRFDDFAASLVDPSWVPLVHRLVRELGPERVVVHVAAGPPPDPDHTDDGAVARDVLTALLAGLGAPDSPGGPGDPDGLGDLDGLGVAPDPTRWSLRQTEVALAMLPHLRSRADRTAMRRFVEEDVDRDGRPAWPVPAALSRELAARDAADRARLTELVEVR